MLHRFIPTCCIRQYCLYICLAVLTNSIAVEALRAQTINTAQVSSITNQLSQVPQPPPPQDVVPQPSEPSLEPIKPAPLPPPEELLEPPFPTPTNPPAAVPGKVPENIRVKRFEVVGSTVFSQSELNEVLERFTNRPLSFAELLQARSAITQLYVDRGYITSGALIPPQKLQDGVVTIQVVEGSLEAINVTGTRRLNPGYIRSRIPQSRALNQRQLLEALQLLQLDPLIGNLSAELSAGSRPGTSVLDVQVTEAKSFNTQIVADNARSPSVGSFRRRAQISEANLLGLGDGLSLAYSNTDGSNGIDASYSLPVNPRNGTISFYFGTTSSDVIEKPFDILNIDGTSRYYELTYRQPVIRTPTKEFAVGLTAARRESNISSGIVDPLSGIVTEILPSDLSPGANEEGRTRISALSIFQEWTQQNNREVLAFRSSFNLGVGAFNATVNDNQPDSRFFSWRGQAQWVRLLAPETLLLLRTDVQLTPDSLVPLEQFGLGGIDSVRGYRQDTLLTDNGVFASAEIRLPIYRSPLRQTVLQLTPFVDVGTTWDISGRTDQETNISDTDTLVSVGLGLRLQLGNSLTARLDWGIPLVDVADTDRTWQENGVYFSIVSSPF